VSFAGFRDKEPFLRAVAEAEAAMIAEPRASLLVYADFSGAVISKEVNERLKVAVLAAHRTSCPPSKLDRAGPKH
jgi:hypothetical protein